MLGYANTMKWLITYLICLVAMLIIDGAFIKLFAQKAYYEAIGDLLHIKPKIAPAAILYLLYPAAILLYGVWPLGGMLHHAHFADVFWKVLLWGGGLGCIAFATYGLTASSLLKDWHSRISAIDIAWGTILTACITALGYVILN
jgi:uncharacterized membrane protein